MSMEVTLMVVMLKVVWNGLNVLTKTSIHNELHDHEGCAQCHVLKPVIGRSQTEQAKVIFKENHSISWLINCILCIADTINWTRFFVSCINENADGWIKNIVAKLQYFSEVSLKS